MRKLSSLLDAVCALREEFQRCSRRDKMFEQSITHYEQQCKKRKTHPNKVLTNKHLAFQKQAEITLRSLQESVRSASTEAGRSPDSTVRLRAQSMLLMLPPQIRP